MEFLNFERENTCYYLLYYLFFFVALLSLYSSDGNEERNLPAKASTGQQRRWQRQRELHKTMGLLNERKQCLFTCVLPFVLSLQSNIANAQTPDGFLSLFEIESRPYEFNNLRTRGSWKLPRKAEMIYRLGKLTYVKLPSEVV